MPPCTVTNVGGGDRDNISWAVSTSVSPGRYDVSGGTGTVILTRDSDNVRHRGRRVQELLRVVRGGVDL